MRLFFPLAGGAVVMKFQVSFMTVQKTGQYSYQNILQENQKKDSGFLT